MMGTTYICDIILNFRLCDRRSNSRNDFHKASLDVDEDLVLSFYSHWHHSVRVLFLLLIFLQYLPTVIFSLASDAAGD